MPQFYTHTPKSSSTLRNQINLDKLFNFKKPIGLISYSIDKSYGFNGETYYVEIGLFPILAFGTMKMSFDQAKQAYEAILFFDIDTLKWDFDLAKKVLKEARKNKFSGDELMFFFGESFNKFNCSL